MKQTQFPFNRLGLSFSSLTLAVFLSVFTPLTLSAKSPSGSTGKVPGNPQANKGGVFRDHFGAQPHTLHPLNATDVYGNIILGKIYETLVDNHPDTFEHIPLLAERWETSPDKKSYTFHINPKAKWQDGKPVTAKDVKFSFDVMFQKKLKTRAKWASYYGNFKGVKVVSKRVVRFEVKKDHFLNFIRVADLRIIPAHKFTTKDPNKTSLRKKPMGSGPFQFSKWVKGRSIKLKRFKKYWGRSLPQNQGAFNQNIHLTKIIRTDKVALETFKKGDLDLIGLTPEQWTKESTGSKWGMGAKSGKKLIKLDITNKQPRSYYYVGYNLQSDLFKDVRVRRAMSHLFDRETFIKKFYHGLRAKAVGPFEVNSPYSSPKVKPIPFSPKKALKLLREAGWEDTDGDAILDKNGKPFKFTVMTANPETPVKVLTLAKETMKKVGVELNIKVVDWTSFLQLIDEFKFEAVMLGWSRSPYPDPTSLWHSKSAVKGGLNFVRYKNPEVDKLIEAGVKTIGKKQRIKLFRKIHELIYRDQPYTFMLELSHKLVAYNSRFKTVKPWYEYTLGSYYWWVP